MEKADADMRREEEEEVYSLDMEKADADMRREEEEEILFEEGFAELAAMDLIEEDDPQPRSNNLLIEYKYSDWWETSTNSDDANNNDIIDPQVWEAARLLYGQQIHDSNGFDVDDFKGKFCGLGIILPMTLYEDGSSFKIIHQLSLLAVEKYNRDNGTRYQFTEVEKVNAQLAGDYVYYITFKAKQFADAETTFQAVGYWEWVPDKKGKDVLGVDYCRLKPTN